MAKTRKENQNKNDGGNSRSGLRNVPPPPIIPSRDRQMIVMLEAASRAGSESDLKDAMRNISDFISTGWRNYQAITSTTLEKLLERVKAITRPKCPYSTQVYSYDWASIDSLYLVWAVAEEPVKFLTDWLTDHVQRSDERFRRWQPGMMLLRSRVVVAVLPKYKAEEGDIPAELSQDAIKEYQFARAYVITDSGEEKDFIEVLYPDYGYHKSIGKRNVWIFDDPLMNVGKYLFAFRARLDDNDRLQGSAENDVNYKKVFEEAKKTFFWNDTSSSHRILQCSITQEPDDNAKKAWSVILRENGGDRETLGDRMGETLRTNQSWRKSHIILEVPGFHFSDRVEEKRMELKKLHVVQILKVDPDSNCIMARWGDESFQYLEKFQEACREIYAADKVSDELKVSHIDDIKFRTRPYCLWDPVEKNWCCVVVTHFIGERIARCWKIDSGEEIMAKPFNLKKYKGRGYQFGLAVRMHLAGIDVKNQQEFITNLMELCPPGTVVEVCPVEIFQLEGSEDEFNQISHGVGMKLPHEKETIQATLCRNGGCLPSSPFVAWILERRIFYDTNRIVDILKNFSTEQFNSVNVEQLISTFTTAKILQPPIDRSQECFPPGFLSCMCKVNICSPGNGPDCFFIRSENQAEAKGKIERDLRDLEVLFVTLPIKNVEVGGAAFILYHPPPIKGVTLISTWERVIIVHVSKTGADGGSVGEVEVLLIDQGIIKVVNAANLMQLPSNFHSVFDTMPPLCQRVHLDVPDGYRPRYLSGWSESAKVAWNIFMSFWSDDLKCDFHAWTTRPKHTSLYLQEINQPLAFDVGTHDWIPGRMVKNPKHRDIIDFMIRARRFKDSFLQAFFTSVAVTISWVNIMKDDNMKFPSIAQFFIDREHLVRM